MPTNMVEQLQKLIKLQDERQNIIELTVNKRIYKDGIYQNYYRINRTAEIIPSYAEVIFVLTILFIGPLIYSISVKCTLAIVLTSILYCVAMLICIFLRSLARKRWRQVNEHYQKLKSEAIEKMNSQVVPQLLSMQNTFSDDIINDIELAKSMLKELEIKSLNQSNQKIFKKCSYCGASNAADELRCRSCGAAL